MIHIAIVEDEENFAKDLQNYICQYSTEMHIATETDRFYDGMSFLDEYSGKYQIIFMDIAMPNMNGMEAARKLREIDRDVCLIFVTSLAQYAIRGYEVSALDFIVKPVTYDLFKIRMDRAVSLLHTEDYYAIKTAEGIRKINWNSLLYIESNKHYLYFHTKQDICRMRGTMKELPDDLERKGFAFISGSLLVNLSYVEELYGNEVKIGEERLTIARAYKTKFKETLTGYLGGLL